MDQNFNELEAFVGGAQDGDSTPNPDAEATTKRSRGKKKTEEEKAAEKAAKDAEKEAKKAAKKAEKEAEKAAKPKKDNIARVNAMDSIADVRKFVQIATAKKAKSAEKPESVARYELEIAAGKAKLADMLAAADMAEDKIRTLLDMKEEPNKIISKFIDKKESEHKAWEEVNGTPSKALIKTVTNEIPVAYFDTLGLDLQEALVSRFNKNDYRLQATCRFENFLNSVAEGLYVKENDKWIDPTAPKPEKKVKAEKVEEATPEVEANTEAPTEA